MTLQASDTVPKSRLAVIRADAGTAIGGGHIMRCLCLADALRRAGWRCGFTVAPGTVETMPALGASGHDLMILAGGNEADEMAARWPMGIDLLVLDHYRLDAEAERHFRPWARFLAVIDDLADRLHDCDLLLDQTPDREMAAYSSLVPPFCRLLLGSRYALLRPEFHANRDRAWSDRMARFCDVEAGTRRVLVAFGSTDPGNATAVALDGIARLATAVTTDIMLGPSAPWIADACRRASALALPGRLHIGVDDPWTLMANADIAIGAPGTMSWERCCLGLPTLLLEIAPNQKDNARALAAMGAAVMLGSATAPGAADAVTSTLAGLDVERLRRLSQQAAACCDGLGVDRAVAEIERLVPAFPASAMGTPLPP